MAELAASSESALSKLHKQVNNTTFGGGAASDNEMILGGNELYWKPTPNKDLKPATTKAIYRFMPQPYCDAEALQNDTYDLIDKNQYNNHNFAVIPYYQTFQKKNPSKGVKGGKFECISPSLWGEDDLLKKMLIQIYMEKYGHLDKKDKSQNAERQAGYAKWVGSGNAHKGFGPKNAYLGNVLVLKDSTKPEYEGKVWLYNMTQKSYQKTFFGDLESGDTSGGSFIAQTDSFGDPKTPINVLNALSAANENNPAGSAIALNLIYESSSFNPDVLVPDLVNSKIQPHTEKGQTFIDDVCEFMFDGKNTKAAKEKVEELWRSEHSLLKFYDREQYYIEPQKMVDNFCEFMNIDERGNTRKDQTISIGSNSATSSNDNTADMNLLASVTESTNTPQPSPSPSTNSTSNDLDMDQDAFAQMMKDLQD